jgi:hypothetical protein
MEEVKLHLNEKRQGRFFIMQGEKQIAEMVVAISGDLLTVYHTEVLPEAEGSGLAKKLLDALVAYLREHKLKLLPLCAYVALQLRRHPEVFEGIEIEKAN